MAQLIDKKAAERLEELGAARQAAKGLFEELDTMLAQEIGQENKPKTPARIDIGDLVAVKEYARMALDRVHRGRRPVGMIWREGRKFKVQFPRGIMTYCRKKDAEEVAEHLAGLAQG